ncbi:hypothetical protein ACN9MH_23130 [Paenibacillus silvae]|uniref:hypothetical protein n=1 Tax=Paenibacillus TaxID=44249 RepID=UPI001C116EAA|nr:MULTISPECIES: hypothetical protein [Paenibacillus]MBU5355845.1 hypothetical protein [Paenibacillus barcinonensis]MDM5275934.1 hypothetical protein [Paenibacillus silvae]
MNKRAAGVGLIFVSSIFIGSNLIGTSITLSGTEDYELLKRLYSEFTSKIGFTLGGVCFLLGIFFLFLAEFKKD